jgi:hypothetical protein
LTARAECDQQHHDEAYQLHWKPLQNAKRCEQSCSRVQSAEQSRCQQSQTRDSSAAKLCRADEQQIIHRTIE